MWKSLLLVLAIIVCGYSSGVAAIEHSELTGAWTVEFIGEHPVTDSNPAYMEFQKNGRLSGNASCNRFTTEYLLSGSQLTLGKAAITRKMCPVALMDQEMQFLAALDGVAEARLEDEVLLLLNQDGSTRFKLSRRK